MAREAFDRWAPLLAGGAVDDARALCEAWLGTPDHGHHVEAHKCLANVKIATMRKPAAEGGPAAGPGLSDAGVEQALAHYEKALTLVPFDQDAHLGRVDLLILAGHYREANAQLDESLSAFESREMLPHWFKLLGRFQRAGAAHEGLAYLQVIERHHPLDHRVASNLGAFYAMTGDDEQALAQLERAVTINPDDPYNHWNLARVYDKRERLEDADRHYQEALAVMNRDDIRARCDYAQFIATRLEDKTRACEYARTQCPELHDRGCGGEAEHAEAGSTPAA
ncbi:MAG: tetratricopeptide repeat protein [Myxococcota bacterium]|jgi:tetratricopeptide (TPR) repeat protein|nr:tetratricopeptide repeat protein [Myxococcota bacterium]